MSSYNAIPANMYDIACQANPPDKKNASTATALWKNEIP
jgi:hypothetical protein